MSLRLEPLRNLFTKIIRLDESKLMKKVLDESEVQETILNLNTESQLYQAGVAADGKSLGQYTPYSVEKKLSGDGDKRVDHITLRDSGYFYGSFRFVNKPTEFKITADTVKPDRDLMEFGKILGLTDESKRVLAPEIRQRYLFYIREAIDR